MKRHPAMAAKICPGSKGESPETLAMQISAARNQPHHLELTIGTLRARPAAVHRSPSATGPRSAHALLLSGRLDRSSAHMLEAEIERLCQSEVDELSIDLTELAAIDFTGVAVIAFRQKWCRRHGCQLVLVGATSDVQLAFEAAGVGDLVGVERPTPLVKGHACPGAASANGRAAIAARRRGDTGAATSGAGPDPAIEEAGAATV